MLIEPQRQFGFTLIELMIGIVVLAVLVSLSMPMFREWMASTQIRNASDALLNGVQLARTEALRRNKNVEFRLGNNSDWEVWQAAPAIQIQVRGSQEGQTDVAVVAPTPGGAAKVTFSPMGGVVTNLDATSTLQQLDTQIVEGTKCTSVFDGTAELCTDNPGGKSGACFGDSGGPEIVRDGDHWQLVGVTSRPGNNAPECATAPSIYTSVVAYAPWIAEKTKA